MDSTEGPLAYTNSVGSYDPAGHPVIYLTTLTSSTSTKYVSVWNLDHYEVDLLSDKVIDLDFTWT